ncbi:MAG TPA: aminoglycoside phosphotransferase family protein [Burkholderiales bacterium]|nr:aminoglycoside phosphotransferase family protein [Burkholderiales bacterium]
MLKQAVTVDRSPVERCALDAPEEVGPQDDPVYRRLCAYREPGMLAEAFHHAWPQGSVRGARLLQTFYNPYSRARGVAEVQLGGDAPSQLLSLKFFATPERAKQAYAAALLKPVLPSGGPAVLLLDDRTVAWWLPNGQNLRRIKLCYDTQTFARYVAKVGLCAPQDAIELPNLIRYVPRRRALFHWTSPEGRRFYMKFYAAGASEMPARNLRLLNIADGIGDVGIPKLVRHNRRRAFYIMEEIEGVPLTGILPHAGAATFTQVGCALAAVHESRVEPNSKWSDERALRELVAATDELKVALPRRRGDIETLVQRLTYERPPVGESKPIHANLFCDQILVSGSSIGIVDWDDLACGDPLHDLGRLSAHLIYCSLCGQIDSDCVATYLEALLSAYETAVGSSVRRDRLRWHIAVELIMRAKISALRALPPNWTRYIRDALAAAGQVLNGELCA